KQTAQRRLPVAQRLPPELLRSLDPVFCNLLHYRIPFLRHRRLLVQVMPENAGRPALRDSASRRVNRVLARPSSQSAKFLHGLRSRRKVASKRNVPIAALDGSTDGTRATIKWGRGTHGAAPG